jgi:Family of unknown function (DUF6152)
MKRTRVVLLVAGAAVIFGGLRASAHHSFAAVFDVNQPLTVKGVLTEVRLENPHSWFFLDVKDVNGKVEKWGFEAGTPTSLIRSGLKPGFVKAGDEVTIKGWHARDASANAGAAREIVLTDGRAFAVGPQIGPSR